MRLICFYNSWPVQSGTSGKTETSLANRIGIFNIKNCKLEEGGLLWKRVRDSQVTGNHQWKNSSPLQAEEDWAWGAKDSNLFAQGRAQTTEEGTATTEHGANFWQRELHRSLRMACHCHIWASSGEHGPRVSWPYRWLNLHTKYWKGDWPLKSSSFLPLEPCRIVPVPSWQKLTFSQPAKGQHW